MFWALLVLLVAVPFVVRAVSRPALKGNAPRAISATQLRLPARLAGVDAAIDDVRSALGMMTPATAKASAALALRRLGEAEGAQASDLAIGIPLPHFREAPAHALLPFAEPGVAGPAPHCFEALLQALQEIDDADLRDLVDAGADPARIVDALRARTNPDRWARDVLGALDYWQQAAGSVRTETGYR